MDKVYTETLMMERHNTEKGISNRYYTENAIINSPNY